MKKYSLYLLLFIGIGVHVQAQNLSFYGFLPAISQTGRISNKIDYNFFASTTIDAFKSIQNNVEYPAKDFQLYIQPSVIYKFSPDFNVAASYTYQRNNPLTGDYSNEHRLWQQCIFSKSLKKTRITNRFRFEERFIQNRETGEYPFSTRLRYQLGLNLPLQGKTLDVKEFYFNAYNEFYFSLTGAKNAIYSENWTYSGIGYKMSNATKLEMGYLLQIAARDKQQDLRFLNLLQVSLITNFDFKQK
ncbi:DUF2490 domain-containing protein [Cytophaga aurantiaca]|uniref:DUF2490 domain-containing protein n=1 Tax=Cytophaga aurantiaca TaxID=29530 RepID=UPI00036B81AE|nr:DUF2490 domain-containing protein [Cytophaga aurantiaca]